MTTDTASPPGFFSNVRGDVFGGITAGVVALPLALGFGVASGLDTLQLDGVPLNGALAGLLGAIAVGILAALFGGTPSQVSGPTGPMTVVVAGIVGAATGDARFLFLAIILSGVLQILFGVLRVGRYVTYIPYPVVSGFMTGIGVIIVVLQLPQVFGAESVGNPITALKALPAAVVNINVMAFVVAAATIAVIYLMPRLTKVIPGTLVALIVLTAVTWGFGLDVAKLGDIPTGRPRLTISGALDWSLLPLIVAPAFTLAVLGSIDSLLTSLVADAVTKTKHDSRRELIGQGIGNMVSGLIGGLPGAGATMRTVINVRSGGRGRLSGATHGVFLIAVLVGLAPLAAQIPHPVLAGILITVGIGIIDYKGLKHLLRVPRGDAAVMTAVLALTVLVDLITAVAVGMVMASLLFMKRLADQDPSTPSPLQELAARLPWIPEMNLPEDVIEGIHVVHLEGSLFFGNAGLLQRRMRGLTHLRVIVLDMARVSFIDQSGAYALTELIHDLEAAGTEVVLAAMQPQPAGVLQRLGIAPGVVEPHHVTDTVDAGVRAAIQQATPLAA